MSNYEGNYRQDFTFAGVNNATAAPGAAGTFAIRVPPGARFCCIDDIQFCPSTAVVNTTTAGTINIGTVATVAKFAAQPMSALTGLAVGSAYGITDSDGRVALYSPASTPGAKNTGNHNKIDLLNDGDAGNNNVITQLYVSTTIGTGTPAGAGVVHITVRWF